MALQKIALQETVGGKTVSLQTGTLAKQAGGSVTTHLGETVILTASPPTPPAESPEAFSSGRTARAKKKSSPRAWSAGLYARFFRAVGITKPWCRPWLFPPI